MKINRLTILICILFASLNLSSFAQKRNLPQKISLDSLTIISPLIDVRNYDINKQQFVSDTLLRKEISNLVIEHLKQTLNKQEFTRIPYLDSASYKALAKITHYTLFSAQSKSFFDAPKDILTNNHKYSLLISISGHHNNSTYIWLSIINNETEKIIYQVDSGLSYKSVSNKKTVLKSIDKLIEKLKS